jgi:shikimate dehydrogenase
MHVAPVGLAAVVGAMRAWRNLLGAGVTLPHKEAVVPLLDSLSREARLVGAVNLIRRDRDGRLHGEMIDGTGMIEGLRTGGLEPRGRRALLVGAGGTARAIAFALVEAGVDSLTIANRSAGRAQRLVDDVRAAAPGVPVGVGAARVIDHDLVINATTLGMRAGDPLPVDLDGLPAHGIVADVVTTATPLVQAARARGADVQDGEHMLAAQLPLVLAALGLPTASGDCLAS